MKHKNAPKCAEWVERIRWRKVLFSEKGACITCIHNENFGGAPNLSVFVGLATPSWCLCVIFLYRKGHGHILYNQPI
jgi:hypothetical protein